MLRLHRNNTVTLFQLDHQDVLLKTALSCYMSQQCSPDVAIYCDNSVIHAHKCILAEYSVYFKVLFQMHPDGKHMFINGFNFSDFEAIIDFIYYGEISIPSYNLRNIIDIAKQLHVKGLQDFNLLDYGYGLPNSTEIRNTEERSIFYTPECQQEDNAIQDSSVYHLCEQTNMEVMNPNDMFTEHYIVGQDDKQSRDCNLITASKEDTKENHEVHSMNTDNNDNSMFEAAKCLLLFSNKVIKF